MKNFKNSLIIFLALWTFSNLTAQEETLNEQNYWQITPKLGYDFPTYDEDFEYIDYKGGINAGLSVNKYWSWAGFQFDFDYIQNSPTTANILNPLYVGVDFDQITGAYTGVPGELHVDKKKINRMFFGIGPSFKYQSPSNRFTMEFAVPVGMGRVDGGEILAYATDASNNPSVITYHVGFDNQWVFTIKPGMRFNYFLNDNKNFGIHGGVYYMRHFGVMESGNNELLNKYSNEFFGDDLPDGYQYCYVEAGVETEIQDGDNAAEINYYSDFNEIRGHGPNGSGDEFTGSCQKIDVASFGVYAGVSFRLFPGEKEKCSAGEVYCEKHKGCHEPPVCCTSGCPKPKCSVSVTAKDKFTGQILPNTDVVLVNSAGQMVDSEKTNSYGIVVFKDVADGTYTIKGKLLDVDLQETMVTASDFEMCHAATESGNSGGIIDKEILYTDSRFILDGTVIECNSTDKIQGVNVVLKSLTQAEQKNTISDANGDFKFHVNQASQYSLRGEKDGYFSSEVITSTNEFDRNKTLFIDFEMCVDPCGKAIKLDNIQFDLDKWNIKTVAEPDLYYIVKLMTDNPNIRVEMSSHTDSRGSHEYNQRLSQRRADSTVDWLVAHGVSRSRLIARGAGETELLNRCSDGVECSEAEHAINRRTEFKVICTP